MGKTLHPTPHTPHPTLTKNFFSRPYLGIALPPRRLERNFANII
ncbi:MAG: hypothetical protein O9295_17985 [Microcystis sp. LE18-22.4A]|nr:hypothetical protein [Microcystis sp. LE18-22.4A]